MSSVYSRFHFGSCYRDGFTAEERVLLNERAKTWNQLVIITNAHISELRSRLEVENPEIARVRLEMQTNPKADTKKAWSVMLQGLRARIQTEDSGLNSKIAEVIRNAPIWWPNRDSLYESFTRALRTNKNSLRPIRNAVLNHPHGNFCFRFQKGASFADLEQGKLPVQIFRNGDHGVIRMPIHADGFGKYRYAFWHFTFHRELPANCSIRGVNVIGKLVGAEWRLGVSFLITNPEPTAPVLHVPGRCGVDVGWRISEYGLRVATAAIDGKFEDLHLPPAWMRGMDYCDAIDAKLNESGAAAWIAAGRLGPYPGWIVMETTLHGIEDGPVMQWAESTEKMRRARKNRKARLERERLDIYRKFAARLTTLCSVVQIERLSLNKLLDPESNQGPRQKRQQRMAAVTILHQCIEHACTRVGIRVARKKAYDTTTKHFTCGHVNQPTHSQMVTCKQCGQVYDQDSNAALNIATE